MNKKLNAAVFVVVACAFGPLTARAQDDAEQARIEVTGSGETSTHECKPGAEVAVTGASNNVTLTGECKSVTVEGSSNSVKVEATGAITVTGTANAVTWKRALGKAKQPKVRKTGVSNKVSQEK